MELPIKRAHQRFLVVALCGFAPLLSIGSAALAQSSGAAQADRQVSIGSSDIGGIVTSTAGPESGVWVIAETTDLPTRYAKIVVTDDAGRYVIPDLPNAKYKVWVRGYGLVDSTHVDAQPGQQLALKAQVAATPAEAAKYYPGMYWYSLLKIPAANQFPGAIRAITSRRS